MKLITNKYLIWTAQAFIGFVFIYSGLEKITDPATFSDAIANYKLIPNFAINFFAVAVPWIELVVGLLLIFNFYVKENAVIYSSLMLVFTLMILISVMRGLDISCGCFGTTDNQKVGLIKILENLGLLILGIYVLFYGDSSESESPNTQNEN